MHDTPTDRLQYQKRALTVPSHKFAGWRAGSGPTAPNKFMNLRVLSPWRTLVVSGYHRAKSVSFSDGEPSCDKFLRSRPSSPTMANPGLAVPSPERTAHAALHFLASLAERRIRLPGRPSRKARRRNKTYASEIAGRIWRTCARLCYGGGHSSYTAVSSV